MTQPVNILVNGEALSVPHPCTVLELLLARKLAPKSVIVEINLEIIPADTFDKKVLQAGDSMEILYFVGGG